MYKTQSFKKKILVTAVASVAMSGFMAPAFAQEEDTEVVITGIRASVINAMNTKRDAVGVVDAISTEDIGKMPDANLAESLQRIPGVSINRSNGEGARVTVRGIDPALNMVTLNNRNMPAVSTADPGDTASRAYDFSNLASEVVSGVELYKTGKANVTSGGLGATINVRTVRPLDIGDTKAVVSAKAVHDTTVDKGSEITPELSGLYSWANDEGTFGVAISGAYQERDSMRANAFVTDYNAFTTTSGVYASGATLVNAPTNGSLYLLPTDLRYQLDDNSRTRENGMLTMQFRPIEDFTATVDYVSTNNDLTSSRAQQSTWFEPNRFTYVEFGGGAIASPTVLVSDFTANPSAGLTARAGKDFSFAKQSVLSETHSDSFGVNLDWQVNDQLSFTADFHDSYATNNASRLEAGLNANITAGYYTDYSYELPVMGIVYDDSPANAGNNSGAVDGGDISGSIGSIGVSWQRTDIKQLQLGGEFEFNEDMKLAFGADLRKDENASMFGSNDNNRMTMGNWGGVDPDSLGENWTSYFTPRNFGDGFQDYGSTTGHNFFFTEGLDADLDAVMDRVEGLFAQANTRTLNNNGTPGNADDDYWVTPTGVRDNNINPSNFNSLPNGKFAWRGNVDVNRVIEEEVNAAFVQFSGSFDFGSVPVNVVAGLRYESTDVTSTSAVREVLTLE